MFIASDIRLRQFALGKDTYEAHSMLNRFGLFEAGHGRPVVGDVGASGEPFVDVLAAQARVRRRHRAS
ncbi:hypothetical protein GTW67_16760 [Streptomyces sp. SID5910]|nr:hypothetical protein [Streptomyces sp. SID5910]